MTQGDSTVVGERLGGVRGGTPRILFLGTGALDTKSKCTSMILDGHILFDVGWGTVTALRQYNLDVGDIDTIVISHFHPDHVGDIIFFLIRHHEFMDQGRAKPVQIIGPAGSREIITAQYRASVRSRAGVMDESEGVPEIRAYIRDRIAEIIEIGDADTRENNGETLPRTTAKINGVKIKAFPVDHGDATANGYIFNFGVFRVGFSGDSNFCPALERNIKNADAWILDAATIVGDRHNRHISLNKIVEVAKQYPDKKFFGVHRRDYDAPTVPANVILPNDGDAFSFD